MADVTLSFDELESGDLPAVCMACGARREVDLVERKFVWTPLFAPPLLRMILTKRLAAEIPLCPAHGGGRLFGYQRWSWWGLQTLAIGSDRLTIGRVHEDFVDALRRRRAEGWSDERDRPRRRRVRTGRGTGGGLVALQVLGIVLAVMAALFIVLMVGMFALMGGMMLWVNSVKPPPAGPPLPPPPAATVEPAPEGVVVGLLGVAPAAGGPGGLPWESLALAARKETFHLLDDAELNKALADLNSRFPNVVADAAKRLTAAAPTAARRKETAQALRMALANPFPAAKEAAAEALGKWGAADDVPALVGMLADPFPDTRAAAMTALAGLKDERGANAVAGRLSDFFDGEKARQALEAMGPAAEPAVAPQLAGGDAQTRVAACGVLKTVGTVKSVPALEQAARDPDQTVARAAAEALRAIKRRP